MKKIVSLILCLVMIFSLVSCASSLESTETAEKTENKTEQKTEEKNEASGDIVLPQGFSAGFARMTLNPAPGTFLGGFSNTNRRSGAIQDDIKYTITTLSDGQQIFVLISADTLYISEGILNQTAKQLQKKFGIAPENIIMNATHSHSAPGIYLGNAAQISQYMKKFYPLIVKGVEEALHDLEEADIYVGQAKTENLNYVRRYVTLDGKTYLGGTSMDQKSITEARHETEVDNQLQTIRFDRKTKKDIVLCNWQCHTTSVGTEMGSTVSADWVAPLREKVEKEKDVLFSYHQGAAGNVVPSTRLLEEKSNTNVQKHGSDIADAVVAAMSNETKHEWGKFQATRNVFTGTHSDAYKQKENITEATDDMYLNVLSIGDVAFTTAPCELHDTLGMFVKENSPFKTTFMCAYSNGVVSYVPSMAAHDNGGYEANMFHFVRGTGELMVQELVRMLGEQYAAR